MDETSSQVPRGALLDTWSGNAWDHGIQIETLNDMDRLTVQTENSVYEITVICAHTADVLVRGGQFFPELTKARLAGASLGGSFLKLRGVYAGFKMEIHSERYTITTSAVRQITTPTHSF